MRQELDELSDSLKCLKFDSSNRVVLPNSFTATEDGWIHIVAICVTGGNCGIDTSNNFRPFFFTNVQSALYTYMPIEKGVTYTAFANGAGTSMQMIKCSANL